MQEPKAQELDDALCPVVGTATTVLPPDHPDMLKAGEGDVCPVTKATVGNHKNKVVTHPSVEGAAKDAVCRYRVRGKLMRLQSCLPLIRSTPIFYIQIA